MNIELILFYFFAAVLVFAGFRIITARNTVHSALYLMLAFAQASFLWMLIKVEFLAIALVLIYVGAVMVLFLFVVMMVSTSINAQSLREGFWKYFIPAAALAVFLSLEMIAVMASGFEGVTAANADVAAASVSNSKQLGLLLYSEYIYPVEVAAVILLVAMVAAIALTVRERKDSKHQTPGLQVRVKAKDRMEVVQMDAVQPAPEPEPVAEADESETAGNEADVQPKDGGKS